MEFDLSGGHLFCGDSGSAVSSGLCFARYKGQPSLSAGDYLPLGSAFFVFLLPSGFFLAGRTLGKKGVSAEELEYLTLGSLRKAVLDGDVKGGSVMVGQVAGMLSKVQTVSEIIEDIYNHASKVMEDLKVS